MNVDISWPESLRSDAKSKKDPHIRIRGSRYNVARAKARILLHLDPRREKITMKLDVEFSYHAHLIGRGGCGIQDIMNGTQCHVHFPDANRNNSQEKSNQVSVSGKVENAERARQAIRALLPIVLKFDLVLSVEKRVLLDVTRLEVQKIQQETKSVIAFQENVMHNAIGLWHVVTVAVRIMQQHSELAQRAVYDICKYLTGAHLIAQQQLTIAINVDVACQHHSFMLPYISEIMHQTHTFIDLPNYLDAKPFLGNKLSYPKFNINKTTFAIKGKDVSNVIKAWHLLLSYLPLSITFDLKEGQDLSDAFLHELEQKYGIEVTLKMKQRQQIKLVWLKTAEKFAPNLYSARNDILNYCDLQERNYYDLYTNNLPTIFPTQSWPSWLSEIPDFSPFQQRSFSHNLTPNTIS